MGVIAYTLIRTESHRKNEIVDRMKKLEPVREARSVYGEYDILVKTETRSITELTSFIYTHLRKISGLTRTTTMITASLEPTGSETLTS